jgi:hypothetical protein
MVFAGSLYTFHFGQAFPYPLLMQRHHLHFQLRALPNDGNQEMCTGLSYACIAQNQIMQRKSICVCHHDHIVLTIPYTSLSEDLGDALS